LKWYDGGGENGITSKRNWLPLLFEETLGAFLFPLFICAPSLENSGVLMIFDLKIISSKTSFPMA
jgi:hypothetical protein